MKEGKAKDGMKQEAKVKPEKKKGGKFKVSVRLMILMLVVIPLILSIAIISVISSANTKATLEKEVESRLYVVANNLASYCSGNKVNAGNAQTYYDFLDGLKEQGMDMAIVFENGTCASSVKNENDYRVREIPFGKDFEADKEELEKGYFEETVTIEGKNYFGYYMPVITDGKIIAMAFAGELQENVTKAVKDSIVEAAILAVVLAVIFIVIAFISSKGIIKSVKVIDKRVDALAQGDLSKQAAVKSGIKEMHELLKSTEVMQDNLSETIGKVKLVAFKLAGNIVEVTGLSNSSAGRANQISEAMEHFSSVAGGMAENVQDINEQMIEVGNCVTDISEAVEYLDKNSASLQQSNNEAKADMDIIMNNSQKSVKAVNEILDQIKETNESIMEIEKAVGIILAIAEQTELLSLNASIEAARAGEHGKGFAVVAGEIGSLSAQSADGAEMIKELAQTIIKKSQMSVELADGISSLMLQEQQSIAHTQRKYEELSQNINQSVARIKDISDKADNLAASKERVLDNVQDLSAISEENYASCEEVTATVNEIVSEVQMVNMNCDRMNQMANELEISASYFHE